MKIFRQSLLWWQNRQQPAYSKNNLQLFGITMLAIGFVFGSYQAVNHWLLPRLYALNDTTHIWTFNSDNAHRYTFDSNLMQVDNDGATVATGNFFTNPSFTSSNDDWLVGAVAPTGWVEIPSSADFADPLTYDPEYPSKSNFLVMKYEAKAWDTEATPPAVVDDGGAGLANGWAGAESQTQYRAISTHEGRPWVRIAQDHSDYDSKNACRDAWALAGLPEEGIAPGTTSTHLITNNEWMTIARNVTNVAGNWTEGAVGSGALYSGHNDNNPGNSLAASSNDAEGYYLTGNSSPSNQRRTLTLSNGEVIWDLAGNVWQWTDDLHNPAINTTTAWVEWNHANVAEGAIDLYGPPSGYLSAQGMGQIYGGALNNAFLRGGSWTLTSSAGAFTLNLNNGPTLQNNAIGFRCTSDTVAIYHSFQSTSGRQGGANLVSAGSLADARIYQSINVGVADEFSLSTYVYQTEPEGGIVSDEVAKLFYNGEEVTTSYEAVGETGWYKLTATVTGANQEREYGLVVKKNQTVLVDDFTLAKVADYTLYTDFYLDTQVESWDSLTPSATVTGEASLSYQFCPGEGDICESANSWQWWNGSAWVTATDTSQANSVDELTVPVMQSLPIAEQKLAVKVIFGFGGEDVPILTSLELGLTTDLIPPEVQASQAKFKRTVDASQEYEYDQENIPWTNNLAPYFEWLEGEDSGSGLAGYCLYLGQDLEASYNSKGLLGDSPVSTVGTDCEFIVSPDVTQGTDSIDFATTAYRGSPWLTTSSDPYYLKIWAVDNGGNVQANDPAIASFKFDNTRPTNVSYISPASGSFSNVVDMNFSWPISGSGAGSDDHSQVLGWQYQINSTNGTWLGTDEHAIYGFSYIPTGNSTYTLTLAQDEASVVAGDNIIYFRTVDVAGNFSSDATIRTGKLAYGGDAPQFDDLVVVTITPSTTDTNSFALSWPEAEPAVGQTIAGYYYMINTTPPTAYSTLTGNPATYLSNNTNTSVSARALPNVNKGSNTVYVVAVDDDNNYSPSNYITGTFTLNSTDPDNIGNLVASDSSIKAQEQWNVTLTWTVPTYQGAGNLTYHIYRSSDGINFSEVGSTSGLSYVDTTPQSAQYYYKVYVKDGAEAVSSGSNAVTITPTGKWTQPSELISGPEVNNITTKRARISWSTDRTSDSKIAYGLSSQDYFDEEPSNSNQVTSHVINLTNLSPGTKYYYQAKWTDEDGNTGTSEEKHFTTSPAPTVQDVVARNIGLTSAILDFTTKGASKAKIYYGQTTDFGAVRELSTATAQSNYTVELSELADGMKYYYRINVIDSEDDEYEGTILDFTTLPRPRISNVRIQQVRNTPQPTLLISWQSNTQVSSIVSYWPVGSPALARDEVKVERIVGKHEMIVRGLMADTPYNLQVKGRDRIGNEAVSDLIAFTTATDTRPPLISDISIEGATIPPNRTAGQESTAQLIVSWNTDEPATSQVEFGEGSGPNYTQTTQLDSNLTFNHLVVISNLTPSKVYHLRVVSKDAVGNEAKSIDHVTITPKATDNALDLVITNLTEAFGFLGNLWR